MQLYNIASQLVGIDLSLLTATLYAPEALAEPDEPWDPETLLQRVAQVRRSGRRLDFSAAIDVLCMISRLPHYPLRCAVNYGR